MNRPERPLSPFMLGPYYKPQLTSMLSITHRITGVALSVLGAPLLVCLLIAAVRGPDAWFETTGWLVSPLGWVVSVVVLWSLAFHLLNGIRHLVWDTGHWLALKPAYASGWAVLVGSVLLAALVWALAAGVL